MTPPNFVSGTSNGRIIKPQCDKLDYRIITLDNGLRAVLVSDPETDKTAASLDVSMQRLALATACGPTLQTAQVTNRYIACLHTADCTGQTDSTQAHHCCSIIVYALGGQMVGMWLLFASVVRGL